MLIDTHMHAYPDFLAEKAIARVGALSSVPTSTDGTLNGTLQMMDEQGVSAGLLLHIAIRPNQQKNVNDFAAEVMHASNGRLVCFGSVHPDAEDATDELYRIRELGLLGIKLHPYYQDFDMEHANAVRVYETCCELGLPIAFHMGFDPVEPRAMRASPRVLAQLLYAMPDLTVIATHMGGMGCPEEVGRHLCGKPVYLDTAYSAPPATKNPTAHREVLLTHDPALILFGSDAPWSSPAMEWEYVQSLGLPESWLPGIAYKNAARLLAIKTDQPT
ncbi:MAG: amidohydrolase family protein [Christensenellales bacterium]|jgi:predicted TIM-barrel fold metal-dependent hydrolase